MNDNTFLYNANPEYIDQLYKQYMQNPENVESSWQNFFKGYEFANNKPAEIITQNGTADKERHVVNLIKDYRQRGHYFTKTNPVRKRRQYKPTLDIENFNLSENDLDTFSGSGTGSGS